MTITNNLLPNVVNPGCDYSDPQAILNFYFAQIIGQLVTSVNALLEGYDYTAVSGTSATIAFINVVIQNVGCQNTAATTITLPEISVSGKMEISVTDEALNASSDDITVAASGSDTVMGESSISFVRSGDFIGASLTFYNNEIDKWFIK